ncbi:DUF659 domain-containing protein [Favolaschia claudopus]|uniref:DUF659 domain-containing protein n=1 Tax=Favolaschia claudopus TaxID=2862362 RepID=A0AAW0AVS6_9AGAR
MPPKPGEIWTVFHKSSDKPNGSHHRATHWRCIDAERPSTEAIDIEDDWNLMKKEAWFSAESALAKGKDANGEKGAMAAHLRKCEHATAEEKAMAVRISPTKKEKEEAQKGKGKRKQADGDEKGADADDEGVGGSGGGKKRKLVQAVEASFSQSQLKVFRGIEVPFSADHKHAIAQQTLRATQSANFPERWTEDPEVMKLFLMMRSKAMEVIPSCRELGGSLLRDAANEVDRKIAAQVKGQDVTMSTDGWRTNRRDAVGGVTLTHNFKTLLVDILRTNKLLKDGESMKIMFGDMIDKAEAELMCFVIAFLTDNDGGTARPYLLTFACCAHQGQLILGDYLCENEDAATLIGELIDFVNWLNNHDKVRAIFDTQQQELSGKILAYILPNLTRWTTHLIAAIRFSLLKAPIRAAVLNHPDAIVKAQVGAETNARKKMALQDDAIHHCTVVESHAWWDRLQQTIIPDFEHICYLTNIAQSDHQVSSSISADSRLSTRSKASERGLGQRMCKHIEKRFKELDQVVFVLALILNPFERLSRFGDKAQIDVFKLSTELITLFKRMKTRPPKTPYTAAEQQEFDSTLKATLQVVNTAFMQYLSATGPFESWFLADSHQKASYETIHGNDPLPFWEMLKVNAAVLPLAQFAQLLLRLVVNQAGLERVFSDFSNKKNKKRNRLTLKKMEQQAKRGGRKNHEDSRLRTLLSVPRYADAILSDTDDSEDEGQKKSVVVRSSAAWRKQVADWRAEMQELDTASDDDNDGDSDKDLPANVPLPTTGRRLRAQRSWFPTTLDSLFGGVIENPFTLSRRERVVSEESLYMELLAAEHSGEEPDDGALEGSDDNYAQPRFLNLSGRQVNC